MRDKNVSCQGGLLCSTTLWYKKYFIFVSTPDCLQGEHYRSSFRLLLSSFHILLPLSIIFFSVMSFPPQGLEGAWGIQLSHRSRLEWRKEKQSQLLNLSRSGLFTKKNDPRFQSKWATRLNMQANVPFLAALLGRDLVVGPRASSRVLCNLQRMLFLYLKVLKNFAK